MRGMGQGLEARAAQQTYAQEQIMNPLRAQEAQQGLVAGQQAMDISAAQEGRAAELHPLEVQAMQAQAEQDAQAQAREQEFHDALGRLAALGDSVNAADYARVSTQFPEFAESLKATWDMQDPGENENQLRMYGQAYSAIQTGNVPVARTMIESQLTAAQNSGDAQEIAMAQGMLQLLDQSPEAAATALGMALNTLGGDTFKELLGGDGPSDEDLAEIERKTRAEYNDQTKNFVAVQDAYRRVNASDATAAGDLSLIFGFMKMLDPISAVREGEFANAQNSGSVGDQITNIYNKILSGERLTEGQRASFLAQSEGLMQAAQTREAEVRNGLMPTIQRYGMDPGRIFYTGGDVADNAPAVPPAVTPPSSAVPPPAGPSYLRYGNG